MVKRRDKLNWLDLTLALSVVAFCILSINVYAALAAIWLTSLSGYRLFSSEKVYRIRKAAFEKQIEEAKEHCKKMNQTWPVCKKTGAVGLPPPGED